jgi:hypothetical protein
VLEGLPARSTGQDGALVCLATNSTKPDTLSHEGRGEGLCPEPRAGHGAGTCQTG